MLNTFERGAHKTGGGEGWADVWMKGKFAWEYERKRRSLREAYQQLLLYCVAVGPYKNRQGRMVTVH